MPKRKQRIITDEQRQTIIDGLLDMVKYRIEIDRSVGKTAHAYYGDKEIAETIQGCYGFSALTWRKAIEWYGSEWSDNDALYNTALLYCASLPKLRARELYAEWKEKHLSLKQLRERLDELKPRRAARAKTAPQSCATCARVGDLVSKFQSGDFCNENDYSAQQVYERCAEMLRAALDGAGEGEE